MYFSSPTDPFYFPETNVCEFSLDLDNGFGVHYIADKTYLQSGCTIYAVKSGSVKSSDGVTVSSTLNIDSSQKSKSTSDIISSINYDKTDTDAFKKIISNAESPLLALFDATKLYTLSDSTLPSDELLKEHLIKINCLFENYNIRMI